MAVIAAHRPAVEEVVSGQGYWAIAWRRFKKHRAAMAGGIVILLFIAAAVFAAQLTPYEFDQINLYNRKAPPSSAHPMGTDELGHDAAVLVLVLPLDDLLEQDLQPLRLDRLGQVCNRARCLEPPGLRRDEGRSAWPNR